MQQWSVSLEYHCRLKQAFAKAGIELGQPQQMVHFKAPLADILHLEEEG